MKTREKHTGMLLAAAALATAFTCTAFTVSAAEEQEMRTVETDKGRWKFQSILKKSCPITILENFLQ